VLNQGSFSYQDPEARIKNKSYKASIQEDDNLNSSKLHTSFRQMPKSKTLSPKVASPKIKLIPKDPSFRHKVIQVLCQKYAILPLFQTVVLGKTSEMFR